MNRHFKLYKPDGVLSQFVSGQKRKKGLLGDLGDFPEGTMAIGRLDADSEGLLLLTTDGKTSELVRSKKVEKEYWAQVDGMINEEALENLQKGVEIGFEGKRYRTDPCQVFLQSETPAFPARKKKIRDERHGPTSWIRVVLREGKFRQVRKMTAAVGFPTLRLVRVRVGGLKLDEMQPGEIVEIGQTELEQLLNL